MNRPPSPGQTPNRRRSTGDSEAEVASTALDARSEAEQRAWLRRAVARTDPNWSLERAMGAAQRFVDAVAGHTADGVGGLAELNALADLERRVRDVIDETAFRLLAHDDASYREVGIALGITRQAAENRYPRSSSRPAGGQPGNLR